MLEHSKGRNDILAGGHHLLLVLSAPAVFWGQCAPQDGKPVREAASAAIRNVRVLSPILSYTAATGL